MKLPEPREGDQVKVREREMAFSFWPIGQGAKREKLQSTLFASDPWRLMEQVIGGIANARAAEQSSAFLGQSQEFFRAASASSVSAARPLLLYYSFMNLAKAFIVFKSGAPITVKITHGLSEKLPTTPGAVHGEVEYQPGNMQGVFQQFAAALGHPPPSAPLTASGNVRLRSADFLSQILIGHRIFCKGEGILERFISTHSIRYFHDSNLKNIWISLSIEKRDLTRFGYSARGVGGALSRAGYPWKVVQPKGDFSESPLRCFEHRTLFAYNQRPSEVLNEASRSTRMSLWRSVISHPPYRKYYTYMSTNTQIVLHQLLSIYVSTYFFGSITRYKPEEFDQILASKIGPFVYEFFENQPSQFLYLMCSEFCSQEVSRAAII